MYQSRHWLLYEIKTIISSFSLFSRRGAEYCVDRVCLSVWLPAYLPNYTHDLQRVLARVCRGSVLYCITKVKYTDYGYSSSQSNLPHRYGNSHAVHGITQCYLPPGRGDIPVLTAAEAGTRLSDPGGIQG